MIQTVTVDIINSNAMRLLNDLELLQLIRIRKETETSDTVVDWINKYKGKMTKQSLSEIDTQINDFNSIFELKCINLWDMG